VPQTGYSRSPKLLKGAVIHFSAPMLIPIPNLIVFQYNPETMSRGFTPWAPAQRTIDVSADGTHLERRPLDLQQIQALAQPFDPQETISLSLEIDATDALEAPESHPVAFLTGVADRLAALQMLLYPTEDGGGSSLQVSVGASLGAGGLSGLLSADTAALERREVPVVLFFFGPGLIVPVRLTSFSIEEQQYSPILYPIRAKVSVSMRVLDEDDLVNVAGSSGPSPNAAVLELAKGCYAYTKTQRKVLALANLADSVESILGYLPF
jgi:hypothetical protein